MTSVPRIAHALLPIRGKGPSDWAYSWVPVLGPLVGGAIGGLAASVCDRLTTARHTAVPRPDGATSRRWRRPDSP